MASEPGDRHRDAPSKLDAWGGTHIGLVRSANQDAYGCFPDIGLFVVADGLGGHAAGEVASAMCVDVLRERLAAPAPPVADAETRLRLSIEEANARIGEAGSGQGDALRSMATTVVAMLVASDAGGAAWAHVGDSRLYRLRGRELTLHTADDTVHGSRYRSSGAPVPVDLEHSSTLLQALGVETGLDVASGRLDLAAGDVVLLCSDGLSSLVAPEVIRAALGAPTPLARTGERLLQLALDAGGRDNVTVVLVRVGGAAATEAP